MNISRLKPIGNADFLSNQREKHDNDRFVTMSTAGCGIFADLPHMRIYGLRDPGCRDICSQQRRIHSASSGMAVSEKALIAACLRGDKSAWDTFVVQYSRLIYHTIKKTFSLYHAEPRSDVVEDLYQEFFVAIVRDDFKKLRQFRGSRGCTLASWLRLLCARLTIDFLREQSARQDPAPDAWIAPETDDPSISEEEEQRLSRAIQTLPPRDKILIDLSFHRSLSPQEIAGILNISVNAVYTQKSRVLEKLRQKLRSGE